MKTQLILEKRQPEPQNNLVQSIPVQDGRKLSEFSWHDLRGLSWVICEEWG